MLTGGVVESWSLQVFKPRLDVAGTQYHGLIDMVRSWVGPFTASMVL